MTGTSRPGARGVVSTPGRRGPSVESAESAESVRSAPQARRGAGEPDAALAALVEQRDFLLASLDDLDRELEAGDIDASDYQALRDDYTARAASVLRAIDAQQAAVKGKDKGRGKGKGTGTGESEGSVRGSRRVRTVALSAVVVLFAIAAGLVIANNFGERAPGQSGTGVDPTSNREKVSQAQQLEATGDPDAMADAAALYDEVLESDPENLDALTYKGWLLVRAGIPEGMDLLDEAIALRPGFAPPHVFKAVGLRNAGEPEAALLELDAVDPTQLSAFAGLVTNLRQELEAQVAAGDTPPTTAAP